MSDNLFQWIHCPLSFLATSTEQGSSADGTCASRKRSASSSDLILHDASVKLPKSEEGDTKENGAADENMAVDAVACKPEKTEEEKKVDEAAKKAEEERRKARKAEEEARKVEEEKLRLTFSSAASHKAVKVKLSDNNNSATGEKGYRMVRATHGVKEGEWFFEVYSSFVFVTLIAGQFRSFSWFSPLNSLSFDVNR